MNDFNFHNPTKVLFGKGKISEIGKEISKYGIKKVLLHYGMGSIFKIGVYKSVTDSLTENDIVYLELGGVRANPILTKVREGIDIVKKENIQAVLAVGGGSVIDSAKAIAAGSLYDGDIWDAFERKTQLTKALPLFTVLTLSATASEMNGYAVVTNEQENKKWAFSAGADSFPKVSVIDPEIQNSLPQRQTVNGAVDALSHLFELYFDGTENTDIQDGIAESLIISIIKNVKVLLQNPNNYNSRSELAWAATLALNGINSAGRNGGDWATHMLEHSISAFYPDVAHAEGLAVMFPAWMKYNLEIFEPRFAKLARNVFNFSEGNESYQAKKFVELLLNFYNEIGAPVTLSQLNINSEDIEKLTNNASILAPLGKHKKLFQDDIKNIYKLAL